MAKVRLILEPAIRAKCGMPAAFLNTPGNVFPPESIVDFTVNSA